MWPVPGEARRGSGEAGASPPGRWERHVPGSGAQAWAGRGIAGAVLGQELTPHALPAGCPGSPEVGECGRGG